MTDISDLRIFVCTAPIKMNFSFDVLMGLAQTIFDQDPLAGNLFLFFPNEDSVRPCRNLRPLS